MGGQSKRQLKRGYKAEQKDSARATMLLDKEQLNSLLESLDEQLTVEGCDRTLRLTNAWATERGIDTSTLETSLGHFGGFCDCEVLANVDPGEIF